MPVGFMEVKGHPQGSLRSTTQGTWMWLPAATVRGRSNANNDHLTPGLAMAISMGCGPLTQAWNSPARQISEPTDFLGCPERKEGTTCAESYPPTLGTFRFHHHHSCRARHLTSMFHMGRSLLEPMITQERGVGPGSEPRSTGRQWPGPCQASP